MNCPACESFLTEVDAGDIKVDICAKGCGGVWFDWNEIKKFDEPHEFPVDNLIGKELGNPSKKQGVRFCPKCEEELCRRFYDMKGEVEVDQCLKCSGIWLDTNEIMQIRSQYKTEAERIKEADSWLNSELKERTDQLYQDTAQKLGTTVSEVQRRGSDTDVDPSLLRKIRGIFHSFLR